LPLLQKSEKAVASLATCVDKVIRDSKNLPKMHLDY